MTPGAPGTGVEDLLPVDADRARLVGRVWDPVTGGPRPVLVRGRQVHDLFGLAPTVSQLLAGNDAAAVAAAAPPVPRWSLDELVRASLERRPDAAHLLAPVDLQAVKACGVTFVDSLLERVVEEAGRGDPAAAAALRAELEATLRGQLESVRPGSPQAAELKAALVARGLWSQYLEVGLGPDPEVFTKAPVLASVGYGAQVGVPRTSRWNNPEPELVLVVDPAGRPVGATLGNDVNLRDVEGRSALLLGLAKDGTASSALGPFVRLFDEGFTLQDAGRLDIALRVEGATDGFVLDGSSSVARISRPLESLVAAVVGTHHQYPDGFALYTGTLFAPTQDRDEPGGGFTHRPGDRVTISSPRLGALVNEVAPTDAVPPWAFGIARLMEYVARASSGA